MTEHSQFRLLTERRFAPFFGVQFCGAMNDNVFKQALVILLAYQTASFTTLSTDVLQNVAQALFILPFFLFSATAGQLADKYEKSRLIRITVAIELAVMMLGAAGFFMHSLELLLAALFLGGVQSALFGPVKYAILPQHLREHELVGGNGLVEMGTSVAILTGMMLGGWLVSQLANFIRVLVCVQHRSPASQRNAYQPDIFVALRAGRGDHVLMQACNDLVFAVITKVSAHGHRVGVDVALSQRFDETFFCEGFRPIANARQKHNQRRCGCLAGVGI